MTKGTSAPAEAQATAVAALDELFGLTRHYRSNTAFHDLLKFTARFRWYSPFNALLVHIQLPGAQYVAPAGRWLSVYRRRIKPQGRPLVILQPRGPVMFVFDVSDTFPEKDAPPLPREVTEPFEVRGGSIGGGLSLCIENAKRDGVGVTAARAGSTAAGSIGRTERGRWLRFTGPGRRPRPVDLPQRYDLLLNDAHSEEAQYATLVHELAHLYAGHLGTPNPHWWPDRCWVPHEQREFEAEAVSYLVCRRRGIDTPSEAYLADHLGPAGDVPEVSLEVIMKAAGLIEKMSTERLPLRKEGKE